jgi:hypothetical protein
MRKKIQWAMWLAGGALRALPSQPLQMANAGPTNTPFTVQFQSKQGPGNFALLPFAFMWTCGIVAFDTSKMVL